MKCRVANAAFHEYGSQIPQLKDFANETAMEVIQQVAAVSAQYLTP